MLDKSVENDTEYKVLARKYRPNNLSELIGQDVLVQTLKNAIESFRLPHAFILTGIRGVGKTSTARIIARSLLCTGEDEKNTSPTISPCGKCSNCISIRDDRHVDVIEMDAASRTGVGDIREIIDSINYAPATGRYKIYIIDEVHMLSKNAFNALLKTLEEPPAHSKFIFATTEIRKIPITILSRCMRFDLPRVSMELLKEHFANIAKKEGAKFEENAFWLIANAAEGSVRDGLSLLDQIISTYSNQDLITKQDVEANIGISGKDKIFELLEFIAKGEAKEAVFHLRKLYENGSDPLVLLNDLLEVIHFVTQIKVTKETPDKNLHSDFEIEKGQELAETLELPYLARLWQMAIKGSSESQIANNNLIACEMILVRMCYISDLPTPEQIITDVKKKYN